MNKNNVSIKNLLQFANKARKIAFGLSWLKSNYRKVKLIIIADDLAGNSEKKVCKFAIDNNLIIHKLFKKDELGLIFNRKETGIINICDENFASGIEKYIQQ